MSNIKMNVHFNIQLTGEAFCDFLLSANFSMFIIHTAAIVSLPHAFLWTRANCVINGAKNKVRVLICLCPVPTIAKGPRYREPCKVDWDKNLSLLCEAVDQCALEWAKREIVGLSVLSSLKEMVKGQIEERISKLKQNFKQPTGKVLQNADFIFLLLLFL